jgi:hypothetical protein
VKGEVMGGDGMEAGRKGMRRDDEMDVFEMIQHTMQVACFESLTATWNA